MKKPFRLSAGQVVLGSPLPWDIYDNEMNLLLRRGFLIDKASQLQALIDRGVYVDADDYEAALESRQPVAASGDPFQCWDEIVAKLALVLMRRSNGVSLEMSALDLGRRVHALVQHSADACIAAITLTMDQRRYATVHSLHVAVLCEMLAARLGWGPQRRLELVCAALTMNIGMHELQQHLSNQKEALTPEQQRQLQQHPLAGVQILRDGGVHSADWLTSVENHHEATDGSGYPHHLTELSDEAIILHTVDVFCAKISPRTYRKAISTTQAERILFGNEKQNDFVPLLIKEIGIYPPGTFVKLANGEVAIVYRRSSSAKAPHVLSLYNSRGEPLTELIQRNTAADNLTIVSDIPRERITREINPSRIWCR